MKYKIETMYAYGWDDAEWTEETDGITKPLRFETANSAQLELDEFFTKVKEAVISGDMDIEENPLHYRIVPANDRY